MKLNVKFHFYTHFFQTFVGNVDSTSVVYQELPVRVVASKIRMIPIEYVGHYSTRMDIFGC